MPALPAKTLVATAGGLAVGDGVGTAGGGIRAAHPGAEILALLVARLLRSGRGHLRHSEGQGCDRKGQGQSSLHGYSCSSFRGEFLSPEGAANPAIRDA